MLRPVLLLVALSAGGAAAWLSVAVPREPTVTTIIEPAPPAPTQDVLVAAGDLGEGQALGKDNMRWQPWPEGALNAAYITRAARPEALESLSGSVIRSRMVAGEPILDDKVTSLNGGFLSAMLPPGKRAVAVRISAENTAGGFILPNDRVDVLHTVANQGPGDGLKEHISRTVLRNVPVLAIDQTVDEKSKDDKSKKTVVVGKTATLELDSVQAEILTAAEATGTLSLALRSAADNAEAPAIARQQVSETVRIVRAGRSEFVKSR
ncbi:MAG TPA: Flp pilus assembly protein CpaB [Microvirga sp.]|nr:Flp pilus assembly protein CpaB [Microvirga sp.]